MRKIMPHHTWDNFIYIFCHGSFFRDRPLIFGGKEEWGGGEVGGAV